MLCWLQRPSSARSGRRRLSPQHTVPILNLIPWTHMHFRAMVFSISLLAPILACASEGLIFAAAYECNADEVNRDMVQTCIGSYPELSTIASDALVRWRARNAVKAKLAKEACESKLQEKARTEAASENNAIRERIANVKKEIRNGLLARLQEEGKNACTEALHQLATGTGAMDLK